MTSGSSPKIIDAKNGATPFDEATVAVMERFNLYDALVRIPTTHGDLGANSKVGHADHLCSRRMNQVPLSDFFAASAVEREMQMDQRVVKASLWMNDSPIVAEGRASGAIADHSEKECAVDGESGDENKSKNAEEQEQIISHNKPRGMSPFDPKFLAMAGGFLLFINFSSRRW